MKRIIALILTIVLCLSLLPAGVLAEGEETTQTAAYHTVTVEYKLPDGREEDTPDPQTKSGPAGTVYNIPSPVISGLVADQHEVSGQIGNGDETITVTYLYQTYTVSVNYETPEGYDTPARKHKSGAPGSQYSFDSPEITGLVPDRENVSGAIGTKNETITVKYSEDNRTILVVYTVPEGYTAPPYGREVGVPGTKYSIASPKIEGLKPEKEAVEGTIGKADETITVAYTEAPHTVTVQYTVPEDYEEQKPENQSITDVKGTAYSFDSKEIENLIPDQTTVAGTVGSVDETITVAYSEKTYNVIVQYAVPEGYEAPETFKLEGLQSKETYGVQSPDLAGLKPDQDLVSGNIAHADVEATVTYTECDHCVTVQYTVPEGYTAPEPQCKVGLHGTEYSFTSPTIIGLTPDQTVVSGEIGKADETITVQYSDATHTVTVEYVVPDGYDAPDPQSVKGPAGKAYKIISPLPENDLKPKEDSVKGIIGDTDETITVTYVLQECEHAYSDNVITPIEGNCEYHQEVCSNCGATVKVHHKVAENRWNEETQANDLPYCSCGLLMTSSQEGDVHCHKYEWIKTDNLTHEQKCSVCGNVKDNLVPHEFDGDTCAQCGYKTVATHTVTIQYNVPEGYEDKKPEDVSRTGIQGTEYWIESPVLEGLIPDQSKVNGVIGEQDETMTVTYTRSDISTVTVHYVIPDGYDTPESKVLTGRKGDSYYLATPAIDGLQPNQPAVFGEFGDENVEVTVTYTASSPITVSHQLTVHYTVPDGFTAPDDYTQFVPEGETYSVASPVVEKLIPSIAVVTGVMGRGDVVITVHYWKSVHTLTIHYSVPDGYTRPETYTAELKEGDKYAVRSPRVTGLSASPSTVDGTMGDTDVTVEVDYIENPVMPESHQVTVRYTVPEAFASVQPKTYSCVYSEGQKYSIASPAIEGLTPSQAKIAGTMGSEDITAEVVYRPVEDAYYSVTVKYVVPEGYPTPEDQVMTGAPGTPFALKSPYFLALIPDQEVVEGTITNEDQEVTVTYTRWFLVMIAYETPEGFTDPETYMAKYPFGASYSIPSPQIEGLFPKEGQEVIEGQSDGENRYYTVEYTKATKLTISYHWAGDEKPANWPEPHVAYLHNGDTYRVESPRYEGMKPVRDEETVVEGTILDEDEWIEVHYMYIRHLVKTRYSFPEDSAFLASFPSTYFDGEYEVNEGAEYSFTCPENVFGLVPERNEIRGTMGKEDITENVAYHYNGVNHTLTVNYVFPETWTGERPASYSAQVNEAQHYHIDLPEIKGMEHDIEVIDDYMGGEDKTYTVRYAKEFHTVRVVFDYPAYFEELAAAYEMAGKTINAPKTYEALYARGDHYRIEAPVNTQDMVGLVVNPASFEGDVARQDIILRFTYSYVPFTLNIHYVFPDDYTGERPADDTLQLKPGDPYSLTAPQLPGLICNPESVSDTMTNHDVTISFTYVGARTIPVIEGDGQTVTKEKNGASFRIQSEHENFTGKVEVDGKRLERGTDFTDRSGSTIVELTESCLRALAPGEHTLTATFTDGVATAKFILMPGDVNGDGVLDGRDAIRLMKYLAGETDPETGTPTEINMTAADMNDDGVVDELDLIRLTKKLAEG